MIVDWWGVIAFIQDGNVIRKILKHLNLWNVKRKPPARAHASSIDDFPAYDEPPMPSVDNYMKDPEYPFALSRRGSKNEDGSLLLKKIPSRLYR